MAYPGGGLRPAVDCNRLMMMMSPRLKPLGSFKVVILLNYGVNTPVLYPSRTLRTKSETGYIRSARQWQEIPTYLVCEIISVRDPIIASLRN